MQFLEGMAVEIVSHKGQPHYAPDGCVGTVKVNLGGTCRVSFSEAVKKQDAGDQGGVWTQYIDFCDLKPTSKRPT